MRAHRTGWICQLLVVTGCGGAPAVAVDGGDREDASIANDAARPDAGASMDDSGIAECVSDADCDDGDPATHDQCYRLMGVCIHWECTTATECDDADPLTEDRCNVDMQRCEHRVVS